MQPYRLRTVLPAMAVKLYDANRNLYCGGSSPRTPDFDCPDLDVVPVQGQSASWEHIDLNTHVLRLPSILFQPRTSLTFPERPNEPTKCTVQLIVKGLPQKQPGTGQVSASFNVSIWPGKTTSIMCRALCSALCLKTCQ